MGGKCCCCEESSEVTATKRQPTPLKTAPPPCREALALERFSNLAFSTADPSKLIEGYEKEPLVSLEEALQPFQEQIDQLYEQIKEAKHLCHYSGKDGLTRDESAAIYLYSMRNDPNSVYSHLHRAWRSNDRAQMRPWFVYLRLFYSGVNKCPDVNGEIWQGVPHNESLQQQLNTSSAPIYTCMGSGSPAIEVIKQHLHNKYDSKIILIGYNDVKAKDVSDYTVDGIAECFLHPGVKLSKNQQMIDSYDGSIVFHLSGKSKPASPEIYTPKSFTPRLASHRDSPLTKHFVCPTKSCGNSCSGNHDPRHCFGFDIFHHSCSHHCDPKTRCNRCGEHLTALRRCKKCSEYYCDACCLKQNQIFRKLFLTS